MRVCVCAMRAALLFLQLCIKCKCIMYFLFQMWVHYSSTFFYLVATMDGLHFMD